MSGQTYAKHFPVPLVRIAGKGNQKIAGYPPDKPSGYVTNSAFRIGYEVKNDRVSDPRKINCSNYTKLRH